MSITQCLHKGGIPDGWTSISMAWLAETHRSLSKADISSARGCTRAEWHRRWAALCEDLLESARVNRH